MNNEIQPQNFKEHLRLLSGKVMIASWTASMVASALEAPIGVIVSGCALFATSSVSKIVLEILRQGEDTRTH